MTFRADCYDENIKRSLFKFFKDRVSTPYRYTVDYGQSSFNPSGSSHWLSIDLADTGPGFASENFFEVTYYSFQRTDPHKTILETMAGRTRVELEQEGVPFLDFIADREHPSPILFGNSPILMAVRHHDREGGSEERDGKNLNFILETFKVWCARPNA